MACTQKLNGITLGCETSMGGVKVVYIADYDDVTAVSLGTGGTITGITMASGTTFKAFNFRRNTASMTSTLNVDAANGNSVSTDLSMQFLKQDTNKRIEISALSLGEVACLVEDANGTIWYLGYDLPVMASAGGAETGTNFSDGNRYTITLQDNSKDYPFPVSMDITSIVG
ncbi:MAG: hypothetical protein J6W16_01230 [Methanobrevibacter sp.]|nr:hypothetical protein [Methanobrevibacter sp.]